MSMFAAIKRWYQLRKQRSDTDLLLEARRSSLLHSGIHYGPERTRGHHCHLCKEEVWILYDTVTKTSRSGERFVFFNDIRGYVCRRCQTVARNADMSGDACHVVSWHPRFFAELDAERKLRNEKRFPTPSQASAGPPTDDL